MDDYSIQLALNGELGYTARNILTHFFACEIISTCSYFSAFLIHLPFLFCQHLYMVDVAEIYFIERIPMSKNQCVPRSNMVALQKKNIVRSGLVA